MSANGPAQWGVDGAHKQVLLMARATTAGSGEVCLDLAAGDLGPDDAVLFVIEGRSPAQQLQAVRSHLGGELPPHVGILTLGANGAGDGAKAVETESGEVWARAVGDPGNLTDIGVTLSNRVSHWGAHADVSVCFEPVTTLLQHASVENVYRFMHVFGQQVRAVDGRVHYHLDPDAHDPVVVNQLKSLCDAVVTVEGEVTVETR